MSQVQRSFDSKDPKYMSFCGRWHVMTGSKILAALGTAGIIVYITVFIAMIATIGTEYLYVKSWYIVIVIIISGFAVLLGIPLNASLWCGLLREREEYLAPTIYVTAIGLAVEGIVGTISGIASVIIMFKDPVKGSILLNATTAAFLISFGLQYWYLRIIYRTYSYIKDKRAATDGIVVVQHMEHVYISVPKDDTAPPNDRNGFLC